MKKFSAILTAVGFACTMLTSFPAYAEDAAFNPDTDNFFTVIGKDGDTCYLQYIKHSGNNSCSWGYAEIDADFAYGDILTADIDFERIQYDTTRIGDISSFQKVGTYEDYFVIKEATVQYVYFMDDYIALDLRDDTGRDIFSYDQKDFITYPFSVEDAKIGDVYTFACYGDYHTMLVLDKNASGFNMQTDSFFVVSGTKGNRTMLEYYSHGVNYGLVAANALDFEYGDILITDEEVLIQETYPGQFAVTPEFRKLDTDNLYYPFTQEKNLTVTSMDFYTEEGFEAITFGLTDQDGNVYKYRYDYSHVDYPVDMTGAEIGDIYVFSFYDGQMLLPLEKFEFDVDRNSFSIVTGNGCINFYYHSGENKEYFYWEPIRTSIGDFAYGDVLTINGEYWILSTYPAQLRSHNDLEKVGTCEDFFDIRNLTVTSAELRASEYGNSGYGHGTFMMTDDEGNEYIYYQDYAHFDYGLDMSDASIGDVYAFACYDQHALIPLELVSPTESVFHDYLVVGNDGENYTLMADYGKTYYVDAESLNAYLTSDFTPEFADVLRFGNLDVVAEVVTDDPATVYADLKEMSDSPYPAIITKHYSVPTVSRTNAVPFDIVETAHNCITLTNGDQTYSLMTDWLDLYQEDDDFLTQEDLLNQQSVYCLTWNDRPFITVSDESRDIVEYAFVVGMDDTENPQQIALARNYYYGVGVYPIEMLTEYMTDTQIKIGDVLQVRNMRFVSYDGVHNLLERSRDALDDRPCKVAVTGTMFDYPTKEFTVYRKSMDRYVVVADDYGHTYNMYFAPNDFEKLPSPNRITMKVDDTVTCIIDENGRPIATYRKPEQATITPTGDADGNGTVNILDVIEINRAVLGKSVIPADRIPYIDFNGDGVADASDSLAVLKILVNLA